MSGSGPIRTLVHLVASPFVGGPERQMLGLAAALPPEYRCIFLCYMEHGKGQPFLEAARAAGHTAIALTHNFPHLLRSASEVAQHLRRLNADVLFTHNYKPNMVGYLAARRCRTPIVAVSRGWTAATARVRLYEAIDRKLLRWMDRVVCVSERQALKVRRAGIDPGRVEVIHNSIDVTRFAGASSEGTPLKALFPRAMENVVLAVGRMSPEKGFGDLVEAAAQVCKERQDTGFVLIGDGPLQADIAAEIQRYAIQDRFILAGFRKDVDQLLPHATCLAQSSHTEGMPNVVLEAMAASVPVVATDVGGTGELVVEGATGLLVPAKNPDALAGGILHLLSSAERRKSMAAAGRERMEQQFTFVQQANGYRDLVDELTVRETDGRRVPVQLAKAHL